MLPGRHIRVIFSPFSKMGWGHPSQPPLVQDLAVTLRGALTMKTADAFRSVYCWQTVRCLELWARILTELGPQSVSPAIAEGLGFRVSSTCRLQACGLVCIAF